MITQETYLTAFVNSMQTMTERFIQISQFDKTIQATIKNQDKENKKLYYVSAYGCPNFSVLSLDSDNTIYLNGDEVYINLPNGDYASQNKYIIGKVAKISPQVVIQKVDNILVPNGYSVINSLPFLNKERYQTLIIEFESYIQTDLTERMVKTQEVLFPFQIYGTNDETSIIENGLWSTNNIYGNIFDPNFPSIQRIIVTGLGNYNSININWENDFPLEKDINILDFSQNIIGKGKLIIKNLKYYIGYSIKEIKNNSILNASILLSEKGERIFYKKDGQWKLLSGLDELNSQNDEYKWSIDWYEYNPLQISYLSYNNPVPQYWDRIENKPSSYKNKLVLLKTENLVSYSSSNKSIYSILE